MSARQWLMRRSMANNAPRAIRVLNIRLFISSVFLIALSIGPLAHAATNLLPNGSLEAASGSTPTGWITSTYGSPVPAFAYPTPGNAGTKGATVTLSANSTGDGNWQLGTPVAVTAGTTYTFSDWYNSNAATEVDAAYTNASGGTSYAWLADVPSSGGVWKKFSATFTVPTGMTKIVPFHLISKQGTLTVDDLSLVSGSVAPGTPTLSLSASPSAISAGQSSTLSWTSTNADTCAASGGWTGSQAVNGTLPVTPATTTTYGLTCIGVGGSVLQQTTVTVSSGPPVPTVSISASPASIIVGQSSTLTWSSTNTTSCSASGGWSGSQPLSGTQSVSPATTTTYTLTCTGTDGSASQQTTVTVSPTPPAPTVSISASPSSITLGQSSTLTWSSTNATSCNASGGWTGSKTVSGTQSVSPTTTTTYILSCTGAGGSASQQATITVTIPAPTVSISASPSSITLGQSATLTWSSTNATSCTASGGWTGSKTVSGTQSVSPTATTTYTLACAGAGGSATSSATVAVAPASTNLIVNGNFEAGTTNNPTNWTADSWGSMTKTFSYPVTGNGGGRAARVRITSYTSGSANWTFPHITSDSHTIYQYEEDYQSNVVTEIDAEVLMSDGTYQYLWVQTVPKSTTWSHIKAQITLPPGAVSFTVFHAIAKVGTLTIDNASLSVPANSQFANGMVTFSFDDGLVSQYQNAAPILRTAGLNASFYIITNEPTSGDPASMTWAQITTLGTQGFEIGGHTRTHPFLTQLTATQLTNEVSGSFNDLVAHGFSPKTFVYPFGDVNPTVEQAVKTAGYIGARGSYYGQNVPFTDRYDLYDIRLDPTVSLATAKAAVDQAKADKRWLVFEIHDVLASGGDGYQITPSYFQSLVDYVKASGIQVVTMQQGMAQMNP